MNQKLLKVAGLLVLVFLGVTMAVYAGDPAVEKMLSTLKEKVKANPKDAKAQLELGMAYITMENFEDAAKSLKAAVDLDPKNQDARFLLGRSLNGAKKYTEAIPVFKELTKEDRLPESKHYRRSVGCQMLGDALYQTGDLNGALSALRMALESDQNDAATYYLMGIIYIHLQQYDYARQTAESLRSIDIEKAAELESFINNAQ